MYIRFLFIFFLFTPFTALGFAPVVELLPCKGPFGVIVDLAAECSHPTAPLTNTQKIAIGWSHLFPETMRAKALRYYFALHLNRVSEIPLTEQKEIFDAAADSLRQQKVVFKANWDRRVFEIYPSAREGAKDSRKLEDYLSENLPWQTVLANELFLTSGTLLRIQFDRINSGEFNSGMRVMQIPLEDALLNVLSPVARHERTHWRFWVGTLYRFQFLMKYHAAKIPTWLTNLIPVAKEHYELMTRIWADLDNPPNSQKKLREIIGTKYPSDVRYNISASQLPEHLAIPESYRLNGFSSSEIIAGFDLCLQYWVIAKSLYSRAAALAGTDLTQAQSLVSQGDYFALSARLQSKVYFDFYNAAVSVDKSLVTASISPVPLPPQGPALNATWSFIIRSDLAATNTSVGIRYSSTDAIYASVVSPPPRGSSKMVPVPLTRDLRVPLQYSMANLKFFGAQIQELRGALRDLRQ